MLCWQLQRPRSDGRPRPSSRAKLSRFSGTRRESSILQAQEKKGQTGTGGENTTGWNMNPPVGHLTEKMSSTQCDEGVIRTEGKMLHPPSATYRDGEREGAGERVPRLGPLTRRAESVPSPS